MLHFKMPLHNETMYASALVNLAFTELEQLTRSKGHYLSLFAEVISHNLIKTSFL